VERREDKVLKAEKIGNLMDGNGKYFYLFVCGLLLYYSLEFY
jgi:hypothetical protein